MAAPTFSSITSITVLVVDDIPSARKIVVRLLQQLGFTSIVEASSLQTAIEVIESKYLGLIISDIHLKDGKGVELLEAITQRERSIPLLFVSSDLDLGRESHPPSSSLVLYMTKPFSKHILQDKIAELLQVQK